MNPDDISRIEAAAGKTVAELAADDPAMLERLRRAAAERLRARVDAHFAQATPALRQAVAQLDLAGALSSTSDGEEDEDDEESGTGLGRRLAATIAERGAAPEVRAEAERLAASLAPEVSVVAGLPPDAPLAADPTVRAELVRARLHRIGAIAKVAPEKVDRVVTAEATPATIDDESLARLVATGALAEPDAAELGLTVSIYRLVDEDVRLTERLRGERVTGAPGERVSRIRDLARLREEDWRRLLDEVDATPPVGLNRDQQAALLTKRMEQLYPTDALVARVLPAGAPVVPDDPTGRHRLAATYPGLRLDAILDDEAVPVAERLGRASRRIASLRTFVDANADLELLRLDYSPESRDLARLNFVDLSEEERAGVVETVKAYQRVHRIAPDADHATMILSAGYASATAVVAGGADAFVARTGLAPESATVYFAQAVEGVGRAASASLSIMDSLAGGFGNFTVGNVGPDIRDYFKAVPGFAEFFGRQDACDCAHCSSIIGPGAYFVDLMHFVETKLVEKVFKGSLHDHVLDLRKRRPDLWHTPVTCANVTKELPQLVIVNEILENYIARRHGFAGSLANRAAIRDFVYGTHIATAVDSFRQPFLLPLARLRAYLDHAEVALGAVARTVGAGADTVAAAELGLSAREFELVTEANADPSFLGRVYGHTFAGAAGDAVAAFDAQLLLAPTGVSRAELGALLDTEFVSARGSQRARIVGAHRGEGSVQNDVENIHDLHLSTLDRLHRFIRLWRAVGWGIEEVDLTLARAREVTGPLGLGLGIAPGALGGAAQPIRLGPRAVRVILRVRALARRFGVPVEAVTVLYDELPTRALRPDQEPLFDRAFNLADFVAVDGVLPKDDVRYLHPSLADDPAAPVPHIHRRLLAGVRVSSADLALLVDALGRALGAHPGAAAEADRGFALSLENLSLLYRHARLAEWLRLPVPTLLRLVDLAPGVPRRHLADLDDVEAFLRFHDWIAKTGRTADEVAYVTGAEVELSSFPDPPAIAARMVVRVAADAVLTFTDTVFAYVEGVSEADSRAIVAANAEVIVPAAQPGRLRLADDAPPDAALTLPPALAEREPALRELLAAHHANAVLPAYLASELGVDAATGAALLALAGVAAPGPGAVQALRGEGPVAALEQVIAATVRPAVLLRGLDADAVRYVAESPGTFALADLTAPTWAALERVEIYRRFAGDDRGADLRALLVAASNGLATADPALLGPILGVEPVLAASLRTRIALPGEALPALAKLGDCAALAESLGIGGEELALLARDDHDSLDRAADAVLAALRNRYPDEQVWQERIEPVQEQLLQRRRDALADHLVHSITPEFPTRGDIYRYFLIDIEVDGCFRTSRIVSAISSLQLYVHRVLLNLEQDVAGNVHVTPDLVPRDEWEWRQHYRVWEANRKVFLWPENYLLPDLRDDKTPLFKEFESQLLQKEIDEQSVLDTYGLYLQGFRELAGLEIAGAYHEIGNNTDVLHLFGVTSDDPGTYYYRAVENAYHGEVSAHRGVVWGPWRRMEVAIPVRRIAPVVQGSRLHVFWVEITTSPENVVADGGSEFVGYTHRLAVKFSSLRLDGRWTAPQPIRLFRGTPFNGSRGVIDDALASEEDEFGEPGPVQLRRRQRTPRYDTERHRKPQDGYTLNGEEWELVYPQPRPDGVLLVGAGYQMRATVDLFRRTAARAGQPVGPGWPTLHHNTTPPSPVLCQRGDKLYYGSPDFTFFDDHAFAAFAADPRQIERVFHGVYEGSRPLIEHHLYVGEVARVGSSAVVRPINGSLTDGILDVDGDIYLLQNSVRTGARWLARRLGTTLAEKVQRRLFTRGVDGLLAINFQLGLKEAARAISAGPRIDDEVNAGRLDFTGPYGTYYREIFFHIPFLIANHLNSQGQYAQAQRWYHYIFDPTTPEVVKHDPQATLAANNARKNDRCWRYLEFRGLALPTMRQVLTDEQTIEAYRKDPFNPHAIARLRLTAYQKAIVMRYIDNLLDWADDLFTQFQMETVNEATILYATAADILGPRPAQLGDCGERAHAHTYADLRPALDQGSEFLIEVEHFFSPGPAGPGGITTLSPRFTLDPAAATTATRLALRTGSLRELSLTAGGNAQPPTDEARAVGRARVAAPRAEGARISLAPTARVTTGPAVSVGDSLAADVVRPDWNDAAPGAGRLRAGRAPATPPIVQLQVYGHLVWSLVRQIVPAFCVPRNGDLLAYWDRVEDRLRKIRSCMDITGTRRSLSLFAPEINPMLLVRAKAAGLSTSEAIEAVSGEVPPYRFSFLIEKAKQYALTVQSFGTALQAALERKDAEELNQLRNTQQRNLLALTTTVREWERDAANAAIEALSRRKTAVEHRRDYFRGLVNTGLIDEEWLQRVSHHAATAHRIAGSVFDFLAGINHLIPQLGSPFAMKWGGKELGDSFGGFARALHAVGESVGQVASSAALEAGYVRREQGWRQQLAAAEDELSEVEQQIVVAELRRDIAQESIALHQTAIAQTDEIIAFYQDRFTNLGLYTYLSTTLQRLHRDAFSAAYAIARMADQALRYERDDLDLTPLGAGAWDASRAGLLAGAQLGLDLQAMEQRYIATNFRELEVDQSFSLSQVDPAALLQLRETGECELDLAEIFFDLVYPGHYRRRIKAVRLTIPCITGPYASVAATLTMVGSSLRREPGLGSDGLREVPLSRTVSVATSSAQNDAGVFELNFRDERYMPFEGTGAVSRWRLTLPRTFRQFDYRTINDVILRMSYTARADEAFRADVEQRNAAIEGTIAQLLQQTGLSRLVSLRHDFSTAFNRLLHSPTGTPVAIEIGAGVLPFFLRGQPVSVSRAVLVLQPTGDPEVGAVALTIDGGPVTGFAADERFGGLPSVEVTSAFAGALLGRHELTVSDPAQLAPTAPPAGDPSGVDEGRLHDILLCLDIRAD